MTPSDLDETTVPQGVDPVADLDRAVLDAAAELAGEGRRPTGARLSRPPKADFGDYSSNAPMLLAPLLGEPPRAVAEKLGALVTERLGAEPRARRGGRARLPQPVHVGHRGSAARWPPRPPRATTTAAAPDLARARAGRVRECQPDRPRQRGHRTARRVRRLARAHPGLRRPRRAARVLRERLRLAGAPVRRVDPGAGARRGPARGRLPGRVRDRPGAAGSTAPPTSDRRSRPARASS